MSTKKILYILLTILIISITIMPSIIAAPEDFGAGLMSESSIMGIAIAGGVIMGIVMIFKMKKSNKDEFSTVEKYVDNYDKVSSGVYNDTSNVESKIINESENIRDYANSLSHSFGSGGSYSMSADIPIIDDKTGHVEYKHVSGIENIEKTISVAVAKTRNDQIAMLEHVKKLIEETYALENEALSKYIPDERMPDSFKHLVEFEHYTNNMKGLLEKIERKVDEIEVYIKAIHYYNEEAAKLAKTQYQALENTTKMHDDVLSSEIKKIDEQFNDIKKELSTSMKEFFYEEKDLNIRNATNDLLRLHDSFNDPILKDTIKMIEANYGNIDTRSQQIQDIYGEFKYGSGIKTKISGQVYDLFSQLGMVNWHKNQYIHPENVGYDIKMIEAGIEHVKNMIKLEEHNSQLVKDVNNRIITLSKQASNAVADFTKHFDQIRKDGLKRITHDEELIFDETRYVINIVDNKKTDLPKKIVEIDNHINTLKSKAFEDTYIKNAIIDLCADALSRLDEERLGKIPPGTAFNDIKTAASKIVQDLKFYPGTKVGSKASITFP